MQPQIQNLFFWVGAILIVVAATIFYQPDAAKTGSLLIWMNNRIYVMDIDTLVLDRVGSVGADELIAPSPGCFGLTATPCWVIGGQRLYQINLERNNTTQEKLLPIGTDYRWINSKASWSPDGIHVAYSVRENTDGLAELRVYNALSGETALTLLEIDPTIPAAWTSACAIGLGGSGCQIAVKTATVEPIEVLALTLATEAQQTWQLETSAIFALRWSTGNQLLYSQPPRHFQTVEDNTPNYHMPPGGQLANVSPDGKFTVYYQPFTLAGCQGGDESCLQLGVWLSENGNEDEKAGLIYHLNLNDQTGGLTFIPTWSNREDATIFFQDGNLVHYDLIDKEATIWYKSVGGKLRSAPVFSPNEEAVAFVDNQGQGLSEYRLVVINPKLQPVEHIIETKTGFQLLAWLPQ